MDNLEKETKQIMRENGIYANKSLGQNFLIREDIVTSIVEKAGIGPKDGVIEIGPGLGTREFDTSHKKTQRNVLKLRYFFIFFAFFSCVSLRVMVYCM